MNRRLGTAHTITMSASSQSTAAFGAQTYRVRIATNDQPAFFKIGDGTLTAVNTDSIMAAGCVDYLDVSPGQKIAVLQAGTAGIITVTELT